VQFLKAFKHSTRFPHRKAFVPGLSRWAAKTSEEDAQQTKQSGASQGADSLLGFRALVHAEQKL
jgi:hypothetical protein